MIVVILNSKHWECLLHCCREKKGKMYSFLHTTLGYRQMIVEFITFQCITLWKL